jgi:hypothetical protein
MDHQQAIATHAAERYLLDELDEADRDAFENHYFTCATCADDVKAGARMQDGVRAGMLDGATVRQAATVVPIESRRRSTMAVFMPWAVAASLALVAGYQAVWVVPGLRQDTVAPSVTVPQLLKPASRGAITTVTPDGTGLIAFSLDLNSAAEAGAPLTYDLRTVDGQSVVSGTVTAPPAGTPLLLVIPVTRFESPGAYALMIGRGGSNAPVAEYRFAVAKP